MTLNTIILSVTLTALSSCNGQNKATVENKQVTTTQSTVGNKVSELSKDIWSIYQDKKGNYWFGSNGEGIYCYDGKHLTQFTDKDGLCDNQVRTIQEDKSGNIWFSTGGGVSLYDGQSFYSTNKKSLNRLSIDTSKVWKSEPDDLWFHSGAKGVFRYDGNVLRYLEFPKTSLGNRFDSIFPPNESNNFNSAYQVYSVFKDSKGNPWFGTAGLGVCHYDGKTFSWINEKALGENPINQNEGGGAVRAIYEDKNGSFWFGNSNVGVFYYDGKNLFDYRKEKGIGNMKGRPTNARVSSSSITEDGNGNIWIATYRTGVWRYDGITVTNYTTDDGLSSNSVMAIFKDKNGILWFGTNEGGVCKFNGKTFDKFKP